MLATIVAVGIDDRTAQLLTSDYTVEEHAPEPKPLHVHLKTSQPAALLLGSDSGLRSRFVRRLRASNISTPVVRIADGPHDEDWVEECEEFLDRGGDGFILGPPQPEEVAAVVRAVCRRAKQQQDHIERFEFKEANLEVNLTKSHIHVGGERIHPTGNEASLLFMLASRPGVVPYAEIEEKLRGVELRTSNSVEVFVSRLRKQMGNAGFLLHTQRGKGYELIGRVN